MNGTAPSFFIIGAPKCGTTSMAHWLSGHPNVFMSAVKEPHYFSTDLRNRTVKNQYRYNKLFTDVTPSHLAVGEASTWYLYSHDAIPAIEKKNPNARYIVMTRDPVEMVISLHHHNVRVLHEDEKSLKVAWNLQSERAEGRLLPRNCVEPKFLQYKEVCSLGSQLRRLYGNVANERILHVSIESLKRDPGAVYRTVLDFLSVPNDGRQDFPPANEARGYRSITMQRLLRFGGRMRTLLGIQRGLGLSRLNERPLSKQNLTDEFRAELDEALLEEKILLNKFR